MLVIDKKIFFFNTKEVYFANEPVDLDDCHFVEFRYCNNDKEYDGFTKNSEYTLLLDLTKDADEIFGQMKKNTRNHIRSAEKQQVTIEQSSDFEPFFRMYKDIFKKKQLTSLLNRFGIGKMIPKSILQQYGTLFYAVYDGETIVGDVYLEGADSVFSWAGASKRFSADKQKQKLISRAERLCVWDAICYYKNLGFTQFDLGGMWPEKQACTNSMKRGINHYKKGFGGDIVSRVSYTKTYSPLYRMFQKIHAGKIIGV